MSKLVKARQNYYVCINVIIVVRLSFACIPVPKAHFWPSFGTYFSNHGGGEGGAFCFAFSPKSGTVFLCENSGTHEMFFSHSQCTLLYFYCYGMTSCFHVFIGSFLRQVSADFPVGER